MIPDACRHLTPELLCAGAATVPPSGHPRQQTDQWCRLLPEVLDATSDLVLMCDRRGGVVYVNGAGRRLLGIGPDSDVTRLRAIDYVGATDRAQAAARRAVLDRGGTWCGHASWRLPDGREIVMSVVVVAHRGPDGRPIAYSTIARDVTRSQRIEAALRTHSALLKREGRVNAALARIGTALLETLDTPALLPHLAQLTSEAVGSDSSHVVIWDPETDTYVTRAAHDESEERLAMLALTRWPRAMVEPLHAPLLRGEVVQVLASSVAPSVRRCILEPFGVRSLLVAPLRRGNELLGVLTAIERHRERRFDDQQVRMLAGIAQLASFAIANANLFAELTTAMRLRSDFVATMSHELRTPMSVILGYHELLLDGIFGSLTPAQWDVVARSNRSATELLELVNAALDLSRMEHRDVPLSLRDISIAQLFDDVAAQVMVPAHKPSLAMVWDAPRPELMIRTDVVKARMVLKNLVGNALKYTERGRVTIAGQARHGGIEIRVTDTGVGIAPEAQRRIFEPFQQLGSPDQQQGGAGLGLYLVHRLVQLLGGSITVDSAPRRGSTFRVWLPTHLVAASAAAAPVEAVTRRPHGRRRAPQPMPTAASSARPTSSR